MKDRDSGMYTIIDDNGTHVALVFCTMPGDGEQAHGWFGEGETETKAIEDVQEQMSDWKVKPK